MTSDLPDQREAAEAAPTAHGAAATWLAQSEALSVEGDHRDGLMLANLAIECASAEQEDHLLARALATAAVHHVRLGAHEAAIRHADQAMVHFVAVGDGQSQSQVHATLALAYAEIGLSKLALNHAVAALDAARSCGDRRAECWGLMRLGRASVDFGDSQRGFDYIRQALALARELGDHNEVVAALSNLAAAGLARADDLGRQGEDATATLETALSDSAEALLTSRAHGSPLRLAINHRTLGLILARLGRRAEARQHFEACLALGQQHGNRPLAVSAQLALLDLDAARPASAAVIEDMTRLLAQLDEAQMPALALRVHQVLLRLHREQGDLAAALHHFEHVHALELRVREMRTDLQSRVLADRVELEQARLAAERAQQDSRVQRERAEALGHTAHQLSQRRDDLEAQVVARTAELAAARDAAERANRAKSVFLANMSHELRTPLNAVLGMTELALRRALDAKQADQLQRSLTAARHLLDIINDVLDISKIETNQITLQTRPFTLRRVVDEVLRLHEPAAIDKGLVLQQDVDRALPLTLRGDELRLKQILTNFASNAVKFTERGRVVIRARMVRRLGEAMMVRFEVSDDGIGIGPELQGRLFQPFTQLDDSTTRRHGGAGLGLIIAKRLAHLMGGEVGVISEAGRGSTFWASVSLGASAEPLDEPPPDIVHHELRRRFAGIRVLLAESDTAARQAAGAILEEVGLVVDVAADGQRSVDLVRDFDYALILMDLQLPRLNGLLATRAIRRMPGRDRVPIVAMTTSAHELDREACRAAGMNDHLVKPLHWTTLYGKLLRWLEGAATP
jgi:signal transduction histidine kinase